MTSAPAMLAAVVPPTALLVLAAVVLLLAGVSFVVRRRRLAERASSKLFDDADARGTTEAEADDEESPAAGLRLEAGLASRAARTLVAAGAGVAAGVIAGLAVGAPAEIAAAVGLLSAVLAWIVHGMAIEQRALRVEGQLADAIDIQIGALRAGASLLDALDASAQETRPPLARVFREVVGRLRLGDDPAQVFDELSEAVPSASMRLYTQALAVQWETGGSLAPTLATVGAAIRDRVELARRVKAQSSEVEFSVLGVLALTWVIGVVSWRTGGSRFEEFATSAFGAPLLAFAVVLQAVGLVWMQRLSRVLDR